MRGHYAAGALSIWQEADAAPKLGMGDAHVWYASIDLDREDVASLSKLLCASEQRRAAAFRLPQVRDRYICARGQLRILLGRYLSIDPFKVPIVCDGNGKPCLADGLASWFQFNVSHSGDYALYGISHQRPIGVDIEYIDPQTPFKGIASDFFSLEEREMLSGVSVALQRQAFFDCWVRKEAWLKAVGVGLRVDLADFGVSFVPGTPARMLFVRDARLAKRNWHLAALVAPTGFTAALAIEGPAPQLTCWQYPIRWISNTCLQSLA